MGKGCQYRQTFVDAAGQTHWDHIFVTQLFSNASHRPAWDFVMAAEYCAVARIRQMLAEVPVRYLKFLKTDCLGLQDLPKKYWPAPVPPGRHAGLQVRAGRPQPRGWERVEDPVAHCCRGAAAARHREDAPREAHRGAAAGGRRRGAAGLENPLRGAELGAGSADRRPLGAPHGAQRPLPVEEVTQMDTGLWADVACVALDRGVRFLLMGDFRQLPAVLDSFAGTRVERPLKDSDLLQGGYCHELTENRRSDERIFQFISWLRVGEAEEVPLAEAVRVARREFPRPAGQHPDVPTTNAPQTMRVWPGLRLGKVAKGTFVRVAEADAERVTLDGGQQFTHAELLRHTRLCHAITYASCQGLTLRGRVWLLDAGTQHFNLRHLYVGASRATSSELLSVL